MKVIWRAEMTMVWRPSYDLSQSLVQREEERRKETGCGRILARVDIALEIQGYNPYYLSGNPQEVGYRHRKGYHCRSDKICPDQLVLTLVLLEQSVSDLIIHNNTCLFVTVLRVVGLLSLSSLDSVNLTTDDLMTLRLMTDYDL